MRILGFLTDLFFPKICSGCRDILVLNENYICTRCRHQMPLTLHHLSHNNIAYKVFYGRLPLEHVSAMLYFNKKGIVQQIIHNLKYKGQQEIGSLLGDWYCCEIKSLLSTVDEIIPVPLHKKRLRERGYNQVITFSKSISKGIKKPLNENLLYKKIYSDTQTKKSLLNRSTVASNSFEAKYTKKDHGKHFLLVDDVLTTGATLENCGKALLKIPDIKISIITIAMTQSH